MKINLKKVVIVILVSLGLTEFILRLFGHRPGYWGKFDGFEPVDTLINYKNYTTDEFGVYKFSSWVTDSMKLYYNWQTAGVEKPSIRNALEPWDKINYIYTSYAKLEYQGEKELALFAKVLLLLLEGKEDWDTEFTRAYSQLIKKRNPNQLEKAILNYVAHPFNQEGFRSIDFRVQDTSSVRILLLGDSFAYGMSARPFFNSYADILLTRGYEIYNTGIPGVDPAQYAAIAKEYVSQLKPDLVILNFSDREDLMLLPRNAEKGKPHEHATNAGFISSYPLGKYLSPEDAYEYYLSLVAIPSDNRLINRICSYTTITSLIWGAFYKNGLFEQPQLSAYNNFHQTFNENQITRNTKHHIEIIDSVCSANNIDLINIIIPDKTADYNHGTDYINIDKIWADRLFIKNYYSPENIFTKADYYQNEDHFNNSGSLKFADFMEAIIKEHSLK